MSLTRWGLWDEVSALPDEMYRMLSPCGAPLSEGQTRKLLLARRHDWQSRLLLVDEVLDWFEVDERKILLDEIFKSDAPWTLVVATTCPGRHGTL